jgi:hypothetical protein
MTHPLNNPIMKCKRVYKQTLTDNKHNTFSKMYKTALLLRIKHSLALTLAMSFVLELTQNRILIKDKVTGCN